MPTIITRLTRYQLKGRVRHLREGNQRIRQELSIILHEKAALEEKFHIGIEHLEEENEKRKSEPERDIDEELSKKFFQ